MLRVGATPRLRGHTPAREGLCVQTAILLAFRAMFAAPAGRAFGRWAVRSPRPFGLPPWAPAEKGVGFGVIRFPQKFRGPQLVPSPRLPSVGRRDA